MSTYPVQRAQWSSLANYLFVTTGAVIGLGNIFQFPFLVSRYGGLFVLLYVVCELFITIPILLAEIMIGRRGKQNPVGAISILAMEANASRHWRLIGWLCFAILFITLSYYAVTVAFPIGYLVDLVKTLCQHGHLATLQLTTHINPLLLESCLITFLLATFAVILLGINRGLEQISRITVPLFFLIFLGLAIYASNMGHFKQALLYLFAIPQHQDVVKVLFVALSYAFFKLNVGMGSMIVYGSYLPYTVPLGRSTFIIAAFDAIASLLAYFILYPLLLANPQGITLVHSLSYDNVLLIFSSIPHSLSVAVLFFFATVIAAWTPTIAMAESATILLIERFSMTRTRATVMIGIAVLVVSTLALLSYSVLANITLFNWSIHVALQNFAADLLTPLSALLIAVFAGWVVSRKVSFREMGFNNKLCVAWSWLIRIIAPLAILGICGATFHLI